MSPSLTYVKSTPSHLPHLLDSLPPLAFLPRPIHSQHTLVVLLPPSHPSPTEIVEVGVKQSSISRTNVRVPSLSLDLVVNVWCPKDEIPQLGLNRKTFLREP